MIKFISIYLPIIYFCFMRKLSQTVALKDIRFQAFHGFYPEEQILGSVFYVDIETEFVLNENLNDDLTRTVNYETLFAIAAAEMKKNSKLIETVAQSIMNQIADEFPHLERIRVSIRKQNPPLSGEVGHSEVVLNWNK